MDFDTIGVISAIFIGVCALGVSIWQGIETRKNYRLSVTPNITIYGRWIIDEGTIGVSLENKGIGPAIICKIEIVLDGNIRNIIDPKECSLVAKKINKETGIEKLCYSTMDPGDFIAVEEKRFLFWINESEKANQEEVNKLHRFFWESTLRVEYKSVYGQKYLTPDYHALQE